MRTYAVQFLFKGTVTDTQYITTNSEAYAVIVASRKTKDVPYDDVEVSTL